MLVIIIIIIIIVYNRSIDVLSHYGCKSSLQNIYLPFILGSKGGGGGEVNVG